MSVCQKRGLRHCHARHSKTNIIPLICQRQGVLDSRLSQMRTAKGRPKRFQTSLLIIVHMETSAAVNPLITFCEWSQNPLPLKGPYLLHTQTYEVGVMQKISRSHFPHLCCTLPDFSRTSLGCLPRLCNSHLDFQILNGQGQSDHHYKLDCAKQTRGSPCLDLMYPQPSQTLRPGLLVQPVVICCAYLRAENRWWPTQGNLNAQDLSVFSCWEGAPTTPSGCIDGGWVVQRASLSLIVATCGSCAT